MNDQLILQAKEGTAKDPSRIIIKDKLNFHIATVFCDTQVSFKKCVLTLEEINNISNIASHFHLFFDNLEHKS